MTTWTKTSKPTTAWTKQNAPSKHTYDDSLVLYDDPIVEYDGGVGVGWTKVPKPRLGFIWTDFGSNTWTSYTTTTWNDLVGNSWTKVPKAT